MESPHPPRCAQTRFLAVRAFLQAHRPGQVAARRRGGACGTTASLPHEWGPRVGGFLASLQGPPVRSAPVSAPSLRCAAKGRSGVSLPPRRTPPSASGSWTVGHRRPCRHGGLRPPPPSIGWALRHQRIEGVATKLGGAGRCPCQRSGFAVPHNYAHDNEPITGPSPMTASAALERIHGLLTAGELTDSDAYDQAFAVLDAAQNLDAAAAYWTGRLEEATGCELWPFEVRSVA